MSRYIYLTPTPDPQTQPQPAQPTMNLLDPAPPKRRWPYIVGALAAGSILLGTVAGVAYTSLTSGGFPDDIEQAAQEHLDDDTFEVIVRNRSVSIDAKFTASNVDDWDQAEDQLGDFLDEIGCSARLVEEFMDQTDDDGVEEYECDTLLVSAGFYWETDRYGDAESIEWQITVEEL